MSFNQRLKQLRKDLGITQKQTAEAINTTEQNYQRYERGCQQPTLPVLIALADYFNVSIDYLVGRTDCPDIVTKDKDGNFIVVEAMQPHKD